MISDGWCYNHQIATNYWNGTTQGYESWPVQYAMSTYGYGDSYDGDSAWSDFDYVKTGFTGSANAATAMSTGYKTIKKKIGVDQDDNPLEHVLERAESYGKATGVITSVEISHATPAGFVAHNIDRDNYIQIAQEMICESGVDVIMGAGHPFYDNNGELKSSGFQYKYVGGDSLWDALVAGTAGGDANGDSIDDPWTLIQTREEFQSLATGDTPDRVIGVAQVLEMLQFGRSGRPSANSTEPPYTVALNTNVPTLVEMTNAALNVLDNYPDGFFLMIEGGAIDKACHKGTLGRMIEEQDDFDNAVKAVVNWVDTSSSWDETLVIVTADHETGYLWGPNSGLPATWNPIVDSGAGNMPGFYFYRVSDSDHTNSLVPIYIKGFGSDLFEQYAVNTDPIRGQYIDNTNIAHVIFELFGGFTYILDDGLPEKFKLGNAYPNPFNPSTTLDYQITHPSMYPL